MAEGAGSCVSNSNYVKYSHNFKQSKLLFWLPSRQRAANNPTCFQQWKGTLQLFWTNPPQSSRQFDEVYSQARLREVAALELPKATKYCQSPPPNRRGDQSSAFPALGKEGGWGFCVHKKGGGGERGRVGNAPLPSLALRPAGRSPTQVFCCQALPSPATPAFRSPLRKQEGEKRGDGGIWGATLRCASQLQAPPFVSFSLPLFPLFSFSFVALYFIFS